MPDFKTAISVNGTQIADGVGKLRGLTIPAGQELTLAGAVTFSGAATLLLSGASGGQALVWSAANSRYEPTTVATLTAESANLVLAGPTSGGAATPTFRALVDADIPATIGRAAGAAGQVAYYSGANALTGAAAFTYAGGFLTLETGLYIEPGTTKLAAISSWMNEEGDSTVALSSNRYLDPATGNYAYLTGGSSSQGTALELQGNGLFMFRCFAASDLSGTQTFQVDPAVVSVLGVPLQVGLYGSGGYAEGDLLMTGFLRQGINAGGSKIMHQIDIANPSSDIYLDLLNSAGGIGSGSYWIRARSETTDKFYVRGDGVAYIAGDLTTGAINRLIITDGGTNGQTTNLTLYHRSTATPIASFGVNFNFVLHSSTNTDCSAGTIQVLWSTATHASRISYMRLFAYDSTTSREFLRGSSNGSAATIGFLGAAAVLQQAIGAAATDAGTTQTLANNMRTALINLGLCKT